MQIATKAGVKRMNGTVMRRAHVELRQHALALHRQKCSGQRSTVYVRANEARTLGSTNFGYLQLPRRLITLLANDPPNTLLLHPRHRRRPSSSWQRIV